MSQNLVYSFKTNSFITENGNRKHAIVCEKPRNSDGLYVIEYIWLNF